MTDFAFSGSHSAIPALLRRFGMLLATYKTSLRAAIRAHDAYENYNMMSDAALSELGLTREKIPAHVMNRYISSGS